MRDITGQIFNRLTAVRFDHWHVLPCGQKFQKWLFRCDCGKEKVTWSDQVRRGRITSCGCYSMEVRVDTHITHGNNRGYKKTPILDAYWHAMNRCNNPKDPRYPIYGARGIKFLYDTPEQFIADMGPTWAAGLTIDRINNDGNYEPGNLRWATRSEQAKNRRTTHFLTHNGKTQCVTDWAQETGIGFSTILYRLRSGWSVENALTLAVLRR